MRLQTRLPSKPTNIVCQEELVSLTGYQLFFCGSYIEKANLRKAGSLDTGTTDVQSISKTYL
jgi:hypothetical protein